MQRSRSMIKVLVSVLKKLINTRKVRLMLTKPNLLLTGYHFIPVENFTFLYCAYLSSPYFCSHAFYRYFPPPVDSRCPPFMCGLLPVEACQRPLRSPAPAPCGATDPNAGCGRGPPQVPSSGNQKETNLCFFSNVHKSTYVRLVLFF